jgi:hypothetical protein
MYSESTSIGSDSCNGNNAYKTILEGLHGGFYIVGGTGGQEYSATFTYSMTITLLQYLACDGITSSTPWASTEFFFAIWNDDTSTDTGNIYFTPQALAFSSDPLCSTSDGAWSGYNPAVCDQVFAPSTPITLIGGDEYQPRAGVYTQTSSDTAQSAQAMNDLWGDYDSFCPGYTGVVLNSMSFTGGPGGHGEGAPSIAGVSITETPFNVSLSR